MSTRGLYGFRKNNRDKTTYNHFDSYPDYLGREIAMFCAANSIETMEQIYNNITTIFSNYPNLSRGSRSDRNGCYGCSRNTKGFAAYQSKER